MKRVIFVLFRDTASQVRVSRNLRESSLMRLQRLFWSVVYLGKAIRCALRAIGSEQLGSCVLHEGHRRFICNWAGSAFPTISGVGFYRENVPRSELVRVMNVSEVLHRFTVGFEFYMGNWYQIDVNRRLYSFSQRDGD